MQTKFNSSFTSDRTAKRVVDPEIQNGRVVTAEWVTLLIIMLCLVCLWFVYQDLRNWTDRVKRKTNMKILRNAVFYM